MKIYAKISKTTRSISTLLAVNHSDPWLLTPSEVTNARAREHTTVALVDEGSVDLTAETSRWVHAREPGWRRGNGVVTRQEAGFGAYAA